VKSRKPIQSPQDRGEKRFRKKRKKGGAHDARWAYASETQKEGKKKKKKEDPSPRSGRRKKRKPWEKKERRRGSFLSYTKRGAGPE